MGMFDFLDDIGNYEARKVGRWEGGDVTVSTVYVDDGSHPYETAIKTPAHNDGYLVIVEAYDSLAEAKDGHSRWCNLAATNQLPQKLIDVKNSYISQMASRLGVQED